MASELIGLPGIEYEVLPSWEDGYAVMLRVGDVSPHLYAYVTRLKYVPHRQDPSGGPPTLPHHDPVEYPRKIIEERDITKLAEAISALSIPLVCVAATGRLDGTGFTLSVYDRGYSVKLEWGEPRPGQLAGLDTITRILDKYALLSLGFAQAIGGIQET